MQLPSLFSVTLAAPVTITFNQLTTGNKYQPPPFVLTALNGVVTDDGSTVSVRFVNARNARPVVLWNKNSTPPYSSTPPGTGAGDTWTDATVAARTQELIGSTVETQTTAIKALFPPSQIV